MIINNLYRYKRNTGGITVSVEKPDVEYTTLYRLIADEGKLLVNGDITTKCVDTDNTKEWIEITDSTYKK